MLEVERGAATRAAGCLVEGRLALGSGTAQSWHGIRILDHHLTTGSPVVLLNEGRNRGGGWSLMNHWVFRMSFAAFSASVSHLLPP